MQLTAKFLKTDYYRAIYMFQAAGRRKRNREEKRKCAKRMIYSVYSLWFGIKKWPKQKGILKSLCKGMILK